MTHKTEFSHFHIPDEICFVISAVSWEYPAKSRTNNKHPSWLSEETVLRIRPVSCAVELSTKVREDFTITEKAPTVKSSLIFVGYSSVLCSDSDDSGTRPSSL